ncbi:hypothetical protein BY996DRAFT_6409154 [Phakopsora pachyrhizi]|nr:hypothetical protein BY996DRAFT_6409154 [Phakopsora pachyrhizi]
MTALENNTQIFSGPFPDPTGKDDNSNDNSEHNEDENEEEDNDANEVNTLVKNQRGTSFFTTNFSILLHLVSVNQQLATPNLKNYQGTLTKSETNPIDINMEASSQDAIFDGESEIITKEAFLKNITVANRHLCLVIDNPSLPPYIREVISAATETSSGLESNIITVNNPGIANSTQTVSNDQQAKISESQANSMHNPDSQEPQFMTSSWNITLGSILALVKNRNSRIEGVELPNYLPSGIEIKSDYGTSISQWLKHLDDVGLDIFLAKSNEPFLVKIS